ncbi:MAG: hypothetical protein ACFFBY_12730, partial [Promethearchaeota archaeon]
YPKSMLLTPGKYKDCESLLLALKPDTGYLDVHKSRASLDGISKLFFEVEEFSSHPDLNGDERSLILEIFAERFSKKLYGELVEDKWNKKLIGITSSLPTDKEMLKTYGSIKNDVIIFWNKNPPEFSFQNYEYGKFNTPFMDKMGIEHLKYLISEPSAKFIVEYTLKLGSNLMKLANSGTVDQTQERILALLINKIKADLKLREISSKELISYSEDYLISMEQDLNHFREISDSFITSGKKGELEQLLKEFRILIEKEKNTHPISDNIKDIFEICVLSISQSVSEKDILIAIELSSALNYFFEIFKNSFNIFRRSLPRYLYRRDLNLLANLLINNLKVNLEREQKPAKVLGINIISRFNNSLQSKIESNSRIISKQLSVLKSFKDSVTETLSEFFKKIELNISDLISFAEVQMESNPELIKMHLDKFERFTSDLRFLANYILRYSTINRFLKEENDLEIANPVTFSNKFYRFLEKRVSGIDLEWKSYVLEWIKDYAKKYFNLTEKRDWHLNETFQDFVEYFEQREKLEQDVGNFLKFLDFYIAQVTDEMEKILLLEFYKHFEHSIEIKFEFPKYIQRMIETELSLISFEEKKANAINLFSISEEDMFYKYVIETEAKYFSKLIPRPKSIILKHNFTKEEKELFVGDLFHIIFFKYWHSNTNYEISDNFKEVFREWIKEL